MPITRQPCHAGGMAVPLRPEPPSDDEQPGSGSVRVPSDPSGLDGLPPYDPRTLPPVPRGVLGDPGHGDGRGTPLDLSKDPDRFGSDGYEPPANPYRDSVTPLDLSKDPDRFGSDAYEDAPPSDLPPSVVPPTGRLDPRLDPDRPGEGQTLSELLGEGAHEDERDGLEWLLGLVAVLVFLGLVALVFSSLGP